MAAGAPPRPVGLLEVLDRILEKRIAIDAFVGISLVGIELFTVQIRSLIASVDTYLICAERLREIGLLAPAPVARAREIKPGVSLDVWASYDRWFDGLRLSRS